jgi:hypothetical protein
MHQACRRRKRATIAPIGAKVVEICKPVEPGSIAAGRRKLVGQYPARAHQIALRAERIYRAGHTSVHQHREKTPSQNRLRPWIASQIHTITRIGTVPAGGGRVATGSRLAPEIAVPQNEYQISSASIMEGNETRHLSNGLHEIGPGIEVQRPPVTLSAAAGSPQHLPAHGSTLSKRDAKHTAVGTTGQPTGLLDQKRPLTSQRFLSARGPNGQCRI